MATRGTISILRNDGTVATVYSHRDNYIDQNGRILVAYYDTPELVESLLSHGGISSLGKEVGVKHDFNSRDPEFANMTTFYGRDREEIGTGQNVYSSLTDYRVNCEKEEFNYIFINGEWLYTRGNSTQLNFVKDAIELLDQEAAY